MLAEREGVMVFPELKARLKTTPLSLSAPLRRFATVAVCRQDARLCIHPRLQTAETTPNSSQRAEPEIGAEE